MKKIVLLSLIVLAGFQAKADQADEKSLNTYDCSVKTYSKVSGTKIEKFSLSAVNAKHAVVIATASMTLGIPDWSKGYVEMYDAKDDPNATGKISRIQAVKCIQK